MNNQVREPLLSGDSHNINDTYSSASKDQGKKDKKVKSEKGQSAEKAQKIQKSKTMQPKKVDTSMHSKFEKSAKSPSFHPGATPNA